MAIPILHFWETYFDNPDEGLGSSYERIILNNKLIEIIKKYDVNTLLEAPSFGFTGTSGINSMEAARQGCEVRILDNDERRVALIDNLWQRCGITSKVDYTDDFDKLNYDNKAFEMSWNFSALWFVNNLNSFLSELVRVSSKAILLTVPNRSGLGFLSQKMGGKDDLKRLLNEENIIPETIIKTMLGLKWRLVDRDYIDCPPWPDIGMSKEKFLGKFGLGFLVPKQVVVKPPMTILDYYTDKDPDFADRMMKLSKLEQYAPKVFKKYWAHHYYMLFEPMQ